MNEFARYMNAVAICILCIVLFGGFFMQIYFHEVPCPLCLLQRLAMIGVGAGLFLNLRFGVCTSNYSVAYFSALLGASVSIRQIMLHICPGESPFGIPVFGLSLYTWAFIVFVCVILGISFLLLFYQAAGSCQLLYSTMGKFPKFAAFLLFFFTFANIISTFMICGLGVCVE